MMFALITLGVFIIMEGVSWFTHKYVMHGFGWFLHEDHHQPKYDGFEKNDLFFAIFAIPSMALFFFGTTTVFLGSRRFRYYVLWYCLFYNS